MMIDKDNTLRICEILAEPMRKVLDVLECDVTEWRHINVHLWLRDKGKDGLKMSGLEVYIDG